MKPPISEPFGEPLPAKTRVKPHFSLLNVLCGLVLTVSVPMILGCCWLLIYYANDYIHYPYRSQFQTVCEVTTPVLLASLAITFLCVWHLSPRKRKQKRPKSDT